jgi:hypothetical protein
MTLAQRSQVTAMQVAGHSVVVKGLTTYRCTTYRCLSPKGEKQKTQSSSDVGGNRKRLLTDF